MQWLLSSHHSRSGALGGPTCRMGLCLERSTHCALHVMPNSCLQLCCGCGVISSQALQLEFRCSLVESLPAKIIPNHAANCTVTALCGSSCQNQG
jgi:hypothetical protein